MKDCDYKLCKQLKTGSGIVRQNDKQYMIRAMLFKCYLEACLGKPGSITGKEDLKVGIQ